MSKNRYIAAAFIVAAGVAVYGAWEKIVHPVPPVGITVSVARQPAFALIFVADKQGFFGEENLTVEFRKHILGRDALADVVEGRSDLATVFDIPTINQINKGTDLAILTALHSSEENHAVAAFSRSGINTARDLKGKRVAMTRGVSTEFFLYSLLVTQGIRLNEVRITSLEPEQMVPSLEKGSIDAAVLFNPYLNNFRRKYPADQLSFLYTESYKESSLLTADREYVRQNSEAVLRFLRALYKAERYIKANREDAIRITDEWLDNYDREGVGETWDIFLFALTLNNKLLTMMEREARFFTNTGIYHADTPYLRRYFVTEYLKKIKPEGVTVY